MKELLLNTLEESLNSPDPVKHFRARVAALLRDNYQKDKILEEMESLAVSLRDKGQEDASDVLFDVMDFIVGWCSPHMRL